MGAALRECGEFGCTAAGCAAAVLLCLVSATDAAEPVRSGEEIYKAQCAVCHGPNGEGVKDQVPDPLQGDRSIDDLAKLIHETMPEDDPAKCVGDDARRVAEYIHQAFYSREARARNQPSRIELAHLTVRQYENAAADLVGGFLGESKLDDNRGLQAQYYNARNFRGDKRVLQRVDPQVVFDFGEESPDGKIGKEEFAIQWRGGVIAEHTGEYDFYLITSNGVRLWVNDERKPLIDAWVKSGDKSEYTATIRLIEGRVYPIRVDWFKFKDKTAMVSLEWRPPHRARKPIPERNLSPASCPPVLVVETPLPPDDSSMGYARGTAVSPAWDEATTYAAIEIANKVIDNLEALAKVKADASDREKRLKEFCRQFAERAFRRPLTDEEKRFFVDAHFDNKELEDSVKRSLLLALKSPRFLYLGLPGSGENDRDYQAATRLSFALWDSLPDDELLRAAAMGKLRTAEEVRQQAERMLANPRAQSKVRWFFREWLLGHHQHQELSKDKQTFPGFDLALASDLSTSLDLMVDEIVWSERSDFRQLLLADFWYVNDRMASFYGQEVSKGSGFRKAGLDSGRYAGVLTHPALAANYSYDKATSPIHRGVFLVRNVLGRTLRPPPVAVAPLDEGFDPKMTTRERVALQTKPPACYTCHELINPFGFSLEHFDAVGRYREKEKDVAIDAKGEYRTLAGESFAFDGIRPLAEHLAQSAEVRQSLVRHLFHHCVKQPIPAYGPRALPQLTERFAAADYSVKRLLVEIATTAALEPSAAK